MDRLRICIGSAALVFAMVQSAIPAMALDVGQPAPRLTVQEFDGRTFNLEAAQARVVIVNFWATWCPPCRAEMPAFKAVYDRYHADGLDFIGLSLDRAHDKEEAVQMMKQYGLPAAMLDDASANGFGTPESLPLTVIIGSHGLVREIHTPDQPELTEASLSATIAPLLSMATQSTKDSSR